MRAFNKYDVLVLIHSFLLFIYCCNIYSRDGQEDNVQSKNSSEPPPILNLGNRYPTIPLYKSEVIGKNNIDMVFKNNVKKYIEYRKSINLHDQYGGNILGVLYDRPEIQGITRLGLSAVPAIIEHYKEHPELSSYLMTTLTKANPTKVVPDNLTKDLETVRGLENAWIYWLEKGRLDDTKQKFNNLYPEFKKLQQATKEKELEMEKLGIAILPLLVEKIKIGDLSAIPMFSYLTDNCAGENPTAEDCLKAWEKYKDKLTLPPVEGEKPLELKEEKKDSPPKKQKPEVIY